MGATRCVFFSSLLHTCQWGAMHCPLFFFVIDRAASSKLRGGNGAQGCCEAALPWASCATPCAVTLRAASSLFSRFPYNRTLLCQMMHTLRPGGAGAHFRGFRGNLKACRFMIKF